MEHFDQLLQQGQHVVSLIPEDMKMSIGLGLTFCGTFLMFGNSDKPFVDIKSERYPDEDATLSKEGKEADEQFSRISAACKKALAAEQKKGSDDSSGSNNEQLATQVQSKSNKNSKKNKNKNKKKNMQDNAVTVTEVTAEAPGVDMVELSEEEQKLVDQILNFKKEYNLDEDTLDEAIKKTREDYRRGITTQAAQDLDDGPSMLRAFDFLVLFAVVVMRHPLPYMPRCCKVASSQTHTSGWRSG